METKIYDICVLQNDSEFLKKEILSRLKYAMGRCNVYRLVEFLKTMRDDLVVGVETEYVDAMYRDEYYRFYASKLHKYDRNCIKLSFFKPGHLVAGELVDYTLHKEIVNDFLGFLVVRPLSACIGRNVIAPEARRYDFQKIKICRSPLYTTALGLKVHVNGYPHASQDGEMMACAETALWPIAEYYGYKYSDYKRVCPSEILESMRPHSLQRQLPSGGLTFEQISVGLCRLGFSTQIYNLYRQQQNRGKEWKFVMIPDMKEVFVCYIESGFPLAICLRGGDIGHAVVCIGRADNPKDSKLVRETIAGKSYYVYNKSVNTIVLSDDNAPFCQTAPIDHPTVYYHQEQWNDVLLRQFMVPLPSRVYMDAYIAIPLSKKIMTDVLQVSEDSVIRTFLASSRSFRNHIAESDLLTNDNKKLLLEMNLPRFVWVSEMAKLEDFQDGRVSGLIVLDATEPNQTSGIPLLLAIMNVRGWQYETNAFKKVVLGQKLQIEKYNRNIN